MNLFKDPCGRWGGGGGQGGSEYIHTAFLHPSLHGRFNKCCSEGGSGGDSIKILFGGVRGGEDKIWGGGTKMISEMCAKHAKNCHLNAEIVEFGFFKTHLTLFWRTN